MGLLDSLGGIIGTIGGAILGGKESKPATSTSQTIYQPSPYEEMKAKFGSQIGNFLIPYLMGQAKGIPTAEQKRSANYQLQELRRQMGIQGVEAGDPRFVDAARKIMESLNMPKAGVLEMLNALYAGSPTLQGTATTTANIPSTGGGTTGAITGAVQGAILAKMLGSMFGGGGSTNAGSTTDIG